MVQLILTILIYLILVIPVGIYIYHILAGKHTFADPVFNRVDNVIYKVSGIKPGKGMNWKKYAVALLATNGGMIPLLHMMLNAVFGGKGAGLMNMIMCAILAVFIRGLMIGRPPEYLDKKIEGWETELTASSSGLDPHITPASAEIQIPRIAKAAGLSEDQVREIVSRHTGGNFLGVFGGDTVNVLEVNIEIAQAMGLIGGEKESEMMRCFVLIGKRKCIRHRLPPMRTVLTEKMKTPVIHVLKHRDLARRIAGLTEDLENCVPKKLFCFSRCNFQRMLLIASVRKSAPWRPVRKSWKRDVPQDWTMPSNSMPDCKRKRQSLILRSCTKQGRRHAPTMNEAPYSVRRMPMAINIIY